MVKKPKEVMGLQSQWRTIKEFPEYEMTNIGAVRRKGAGSRTMKVHKEKSITPSTSYLYYRLRKDGVMHRGRLGELIVATWGRGS